MEGSSMLSLLGALFFCLVKMAHSQTIPLPAFSDLKQNYPGFHKYGGHFRRHDVIELLGIQKESSAMLLHDSSALRISHALNKIGNQHSLGTGTIHLSKYGTDSVAGNQGAQYIFHPLAFGPYLADKYGYPTVTKMHLFDPVKTRESFQGKQGIMRVITYAQHDNEPRGHVALWDCTGFYKARDFFQGHTLLSVEFWESPDTDCSSADDAITEPGSSTIKTVPRPQSTIKAAPRPQSNPQTPPSLLKAILQRRLRHLSHRKRG